MMPENSAQESPNGIKLRKFPHPFRAALSISSDRHGLHDTQDFLKMHRFLNTSEETPHGTGLGLDITDTFWFYDKVGRFSYFKNYSNEPSNQAPYIREFIRCGLIDAMHTWGDFSEQTYEKKYAEWACKEIIAQNMQVPVWINHGDRNNTQNINYGVAHHQGARADSENYHRPLLDEISIKYFWRRLTPLIGQQRKITLEEYKQLTADWGGNLNKYRRSAKWIIMKLNEAVGAPMEIDDDAMDNRLLREVELDDRSKMLEFRRFNNAPTGIWHGVFAPDLGRQISPDVLDTLEKNNGYLILYNHLDTGDLYTSGNLEALRHLSERAHSGRIWVSGLARLLKYNQINEHLKWSEKKDDSGNIIVDIESTTIDSLGGSIDINEESLNGITFDTPGYINLQFHLNGKPLPIPFITETGNSKLYGFPVGRAEFPAEMIVEEESRY